MATIILTAHACKFENTATARCMSYSPFAKPLLREVIEAKNCAEIDAASRDVSRRVEAEHPGSFLVSATLKSGRAPNGFRQRRPLEVDRCTNETRQAA
jgi:hypothetical protein